MSSTLVQSCINVIQMFFVCVFVNCPRNFKLEMTDNNKKLNSITLGPYTRTSYDISLDSDLSRCPSRPIRTIRYIVTGTRIRALVDIDTI